MRSNLYRPSGRREIAESVLTAALCAAATALVEVVANAVDRAQEARTKREPVPGEGKKRKKGKK